jgi:hypothetical protein
VASDFAANTTTSPSLSLNRRQIHQGVTDVYAFLSNKGWSAVAPALCGVHVHWTKTSRHSYAVADVRRPDA